MSQQMPAIICLWHFANIKFKMIFFSFFHRLRVVLNYRERWTGWHQIRARMMISSQFPYPTVTRMETSMLNRSVNVCVHFSWALIRYWRDHCTNMVQVPVNYDIFRLWQIKKYTLKALKYNKYVTSIVTGEWWARTQNMLAFNKTTLILPVNTNKYLSSSLTRQRQNSNQATGKWVVKIWIVCLEWIWLRVIPSPFKFCFCFLKASLYQMFSMESFPDGKHEIKPETVLRNVPARRVRLILLCTHKKLFTFGNQLQNCMISPFFS